MRISAIIPAYNRADLIGETLRSVLEQDRPPDEVIVVDDGSGDGTADVVAGFGAAVTLIRQANAGPGPARNAGFAASTGDVVHFMDSDDLVSRNFYAVAAAAIARGAAMTYGPWLKTQFAGTMLAPESVVLQQGPVPPRMPIDLASMMVEWFTVFQPCLFRRDLIVRAGPYRSDLMPSEDMELLSRILALHPVLAHTPETIVLYRIHPENQISERDVGRRLVDRAKAWEVLEGHLSARGDVSPALRRRFVRHKNEVAIALRPWDATRADALATDVPWRIKATRPLWLLAGRIEARLRVALLDNPYSWSMAAGPLTDGQRHEIARLGYELP